jgi:imidazolonepropionase-like amidohydrolase
MIVMITAITPSLNASSLPLPMAASRGFAAKYRAFRALVASVLFVAAAFAPPARAADPPARSLAIVGATIIHPERDRASAAEEHATIVVTGNRIASVTTRWAKIPPGATIIDGRGKWVVPGLVDGHVHFFQSGNLYTRPDAADFNKWMPYAKEVERNKARLPATFKVWLASGVTSVVDIGGPFWNFEMRDLARKSTAAPRVAVAGPLISTIDDPPLDLGDPPIIKITSEDEARALVRRELARKPDYIKVWFIYRFDADLPAQERIVKATADEAHAGGVPLAVHATQLVTAKAALRAGADYLVHSVDDAPIDDEFLRLARSREVLYCPTLFVHAGYPLALSNQWKPTEAEARLADPQILAAMSDLDRIPREMIPERVVKAMESPRPMRPPEAAMRNLRVVWDAGIPVVMGTDAGNIGTLHGPSIFREIALMQEAGLTPLEILRSATVNGAKAMRRSSELGTIEAGRLADLVVLDADPLADPQNLSRIHRVVKDGVVFDPAELSRSIR